jgi:hypothetical protein
VNDVVAANWINRRSLTLFGCVFALMSAALLIGKFAIPGAGGLTAEWLGGDFISFFAAASAAASGDAARVYDHDWFRGFEASLTGAQFFWVYPYPPIAMLLSLPLTLLPCLPSLFVWVLTGTALCFELLRRLVGRRAAALATAGAPAVVVNIFGGQNGCFTAALLGGGLMVVHRSPVTAGILFGCLAYKPQMAVAVPFALAAAGNWRAIAAAAATVGVLLLATLTLFGSASWVGFIEQAPAYGHAFEHNDAFWARMPTVFAAMREGGAAPTLAFAVQLISAGFALGTLVIIWRSPTSAEIKAASLPVATFLVTPYAFYYDATILIFAAAWLGREGVRTGFLPGERVGFAMLLILPLPVVLSARMAHLQIGPFVLWLVLLLLARRSARMSTIVAAFQRRAASAGEGNMKTDAMPRDEAEFGVP